MILNLDELIEKLEIAREKLGGNTTVLMCEEDTGTQVEVGGVCADIGGDGSDVVVIVTPYTAGEMSGPLL